MTRDPDPRGHTDRGRTRDRDPRTLSEGGAPAPEVRKLARVVSQLARASSWGVRAGTAVRFGSTSSRNAYPCGVPVADRYGPTR